MYIYITEHQVIYSKYRQFKKSVAGRKKEWCVYRQSIFLDLYPKESDVDLGGSQESQ